MYFFCAAIHGEAFMQKKSQTKNQHYVPQFYLRNFSEDGHGIRTFNLSSGKVIPHAKLKYQCSKDYFYGEDGTLEKALGGMETSFSLTFKKCLELNSKERISDEDFYLLSMFAAVQHMRTKKYLDIMEQFGKQTYGTLAELYIKTHKLNLSPDQYRIDTDPDFPRYILRIGILHQPLLNDLECIILENKTQEDFVLSDNPVILQNPFLEKFVKFNCNGMATRGLQIYFPLSPRRMFCFYDPEVYKFVGRNVTGLGSPKDVEQLNRLQFMNAEKNIYLKEDNVACEKYFLFRTTHVDAQLDPIGKYVNPLKPDNFLFRISPSSINIGFKLSVFSIKPAMLKEAYQGHRDLRQWVRNEKTKFLVREFAKAVDNGLCEGADYAKFREQKVNEILNSIKRSEWMNKLRLNKKT